MNQRRRSQGFGRNVQPIRAARQDRHKRPSRRRRSPFLGFLAIGMVVAFAAPIAIHYLDVADMTVPPDFALAAQLAGESSPNFIRVPDQVAAPAPRHISLCPPQFRRGGGGATCVTDGDSGVEAGEPWRLTSRSGGVDAPEIGRPGCAAERSAGERSRNRLRNLMSSGYTMSGASFDRYDRRLVVVTLADGRDAGEVLISEGLAQPWPNQSNPWCR